MPTIISAQRSSAGSRSGRGGPRPRRPGRPPVAPPVTPPAITPRSSTDSVKRPTHCAGRTTSEVDQLVEVPLVVRNVCSSGTARCSRAGCRARDPDPVRDRMPSPRSAPPMTRPIHAVPVLGSMLRTGASRRTSGARNWVMTSSTPGICETPPTTASSARIAIGILIASSRSAMWCSGPGKPTSVSSTSPVPGLSRHSGWREVALLELACLLARVAEERAEDHPERVDPGQKRPDVAEDPEDLEAPAAVVQVADDVVLGEPAGERRKARTAPGRRSMKQTNVNGIALRKPLIRSSDCSPPIAQMIEPARHEQQRLEERVGHEVEQPGRCRRPTETAMIM